MENHTFIYRHNLMKLLCLAGLIVSFAISACDFRKVEAQTATNSKKENTMESVQSVTTIQHSRPASPYFPRPTGCQAHCTQHTQS